MNRKNKDNSIEFFIDIFDDISKENNDLALIYKSQEISYQDLHKLSTKYANYFISHGILPGDIVAICLERNEQFLPSIIGLLKAGAAYLPLDPSFPISRLNYMIDDSELTTIITQSDLTWIFEKQKKKNILEIDKINLIEITSDEPGITISGDDLAYMIYTSGSTGNPKGVQIQHKALLNFLLSMKKKPGIDSHDRILALTTLSFDISGLELYLPLIAGATIVLVNSEQSKDPEQLIEIINKSKVSIMQATPATYHMLIDAEWANKTVKKILCGGEALSQDLASHLLDRVQEVWNMYGPTETTIWSTLYRVDRRDMKPLIGKPIDNTSIHILDESHTPVSNGDIGDLYIGGQGLSLGYYNRPELNSEKFINLSSLDGSVERVYKTGDLCRMLEDGNLEYIGRSDFQVKIRGYRIELGEIESALIRIPCVHNAVVVTKESTQGRKQIIAYIMAEKDSKHDTNSIKEELRKILPLYMIPNSMIFVNEFPLTPNGKIDRKQLMQIELPVLSDCTAIGKLSNEEAIISEIFEKCLGIPILDKNKSFIDYGGDSITSLRVLYRLQEKIDHIPPNWSQLKITSIAKLIKQTGQKNRKWTSYFKFTTLAPDVILRCVAIISVVAAHLGWNGFSLSGDIHILLLLAGYNFGQFLLPVILENDNVKRLNEYIKKIILTSLPLMILLYLSNTPRHISTILFYSNLFDYSQNQIGKNIGMWFIGCYIQIFILMWILLSNRKIRLVWKKYNFHFTVILFTITFLIRFLLPGLFHFDYLIHGFPRLSIWTYNPITHLSTVVLGILISFSNSKIKKGMVFIVSILFSVLLSLSNTFDSWLVFSVSIGLLLFSNNKLQLPYFLVRPIILISSASLYIYLTHWLIFISLLQLPFARILWLFTIISIICGVILSNIWEFFYLKANICIRNLRLVDNKRYKSI